jgi:threonine dehydrogenase-like Zn-dependent dehydrogenase
VDVAVELSGSPAAFASGLPLVRMGGVYVLVGAVCPTPAVPVLLEQIVRRQWTLRGVHNYAPEDLERAVHFLGHAEAYPFASLATDWFPLAQADEAFRKARASGVLRVGVRP